MKAIIPAVASLLVLSACATTPAPVATAKAELKPTAGNTAAGTVTFTQTGDKLKVTLTATGVPAGLHGFHVHETGDCSAPDAMSAGGHFNPAGVSHGGPGAGAKHAGDFGNVTANESGNVSFELEVPVAQLTVTAGAAHNVVGRGIILHAAPDDLTTQPTGNAGKRLACGVVTAA